MAKVIDFKSRMVLADLPTVRTRREVKAWNVKGGPATGNSIIAHDHIEASDTLHRIVMALIETKNKVA